MFTRRLRELGVTKAAFAERCGIRHETVSRWREAPPGWALELVRAWEKNRRLEQDMEQGPVRPPA
jgi:DNA-binding transcriptional regulator YiaG